MALKEGCNSGIGAALVIENLICDMRRNAQTGHSKILMCGASREDAIMATPESSSNRRLA
jgi:hypothetical protein